MYMKEFLMGMLYFAKKLFDLFIIIPDDVVPKVATLNSVYYPIKYTIHKK